MSEPTVVVCSRCSASITPDDLTAGLAVRVDGDFVCEMCVDSLPEKAVVRINQIRAIKGLEAKTYSVLYAKAPHTQLYSFTTAANITQHRRTLARDGFFEAPPLPPPGERLAKNDSEKNAEKDAAKIAAKHAVTDRVAREVKPGAKPMLLAALGTGALLIGIVVIVSFFAGGKKSPPAATAELTPSTATNPLANTPAPAAPVTQKSRFDYSPDPLVAWSTASQDRACPIDVRQAIAVELISKRQRELELAEEAINAQQLDTALAQLHALSVPDDIVFSSVRERESEVRQRLAAARTLAATPPIAQVVPPIPAAREPPPTPSVSVNAPASVTELTPPVSTPSISVTPPAANTPPTETGEIPVAPVIPATPSKPTDPAIITFWQGNFLSSGRDKLPQVISQDGSTYIPDGWYGGTHKIMQASRVASLKRYGAYADIKKISLVDGGVAVLLHPLRSDRKSLKLYVTNEKGVTEQLGVINFPANTWTTAILPLPTASSFDASSIITLGIEDLPGDSEFPDENGFLFSKIALVSGRAPTIDDLAVRPSAIMPDDNRSRNLTKLLTTAARTRKRTDFKRVFEWDKTRFLFAEKLIALPNITTTMKSLSRIAPAITTLKLNDNWLDTMTKGRGAPLDPSTTHIAVFWTAGEESILSADANTLALQFFKKRLEQTIDAGIIPVLVIGPNCQSEPRRSVCENTWSNLAQLPPIRLMSVPVIDLRALTTADDGSMDDKTQVLAAHLINDALKEIEYQFRRLGALK
jgi:hypothetical protein